MARKSINVKEKLELKLVKLNNLVDSYGDEKAQESALKKSLAEKNEQIKQLMNEQFKEDEEGNRFYEGSKYVASLITRDTSKMNEEKLIAYLKENGLAKGIVKKKEYIDEKAFENAVYANKITEEQLVEMDSCKDYSSTQVLTIKKLKGGK